MRAIFPAVLIITACIPPVRADEPHTVGGKTADDWIAVFRDRTSRDAQRLRSLWALRCFGAEAKAAVPDLVAAVKVDQLRDGAVGALIQIGAAPEVTLPILIDRFVKRGCQHPTGQGTFVFDGSIDRNLARVGAPAVPALLKILNGPDDDMRVCAANVLGKIGPPARVAVPDLIRVIEQSDPTKEPRTLVYYAVRALGGIGPDARAAIPALNRFYDREPMGDGLWEHRFEVVMAMDRIGTPPVQKALDGFLCDGDPLVAWQLAWLGPKARDAVPSLRAALKDRRLQVRLSSAIALAQIDPSAKEAIPILIEGLDHFEDEELELDVFEIPKALARLNPGAREALPALIRLVEKGFDGMDLFEALAQIDPKGTACVPVLIEALKEDNSVVDEAALCLGLLGPRARKAVPALAEVHAREFRVRDV